MQLEFDIPFRCANLTVIASSCASVAVVKQLTRAGSLGLCSASMAAGRAVRGASQLVLSSMHKSIS
jgi:hypothetical protein